MPTSGKSSGGKGGRRARSAPSSPPPARKRAAATSSTSSTDRIAVGVIRKAHGIRGEASVEIWTDSADRFDELREVTLVAPGERAMRDATIESSRAHGGRGLMKFCCCNSLEERRVLKKWWMGIPESDVRGREEEQYFLHDLAGVALVDSDGRKRGGVKEAYEGGGGVLLSVARPNGEFEVPF